MLVRASFAPRSPLPLHDLSLITPLSLPLGLLERTAFAPHDMGLSRRVALFLVAPAPADPYPNPDPSPNPGHNPDHPNQVAPTAVDP